MQLPSWVLSLICCLNLNERFSVLFKFSIILLFVEASKLYGEKTNTKKKKCCYISHHLITSLFPTWFALLTMPSASIASIILAALL